MARFTRRRRKKNEPLQGGEEKGRGLGYRLQEHARCLVKGKDWLKVSSSKGGTNEVHLEKQKQIAKGKGGRGGGERIPELDGKRRECTRAWFGKKSKGSGNAMTVTQSEGPYSGRGNVEHNRFRSRGGRGLEGGGEIYLN